MYLLDEPEVSLSPANQMALAEEINKISRLLECQFIIATHLPFMMGTLNAKYITLIQKRMILLSGAIWRMYDIFIISLKRMKRNLSK